MQNSIIKYFEGNLSTQERRELFRLLESDPELREEFADTQNLYALTSWLPLDADEAESVGRLLDFKQGQNKKRKSRMILWRHLAGYGAAILITAFLTSLAADRQLLRKMIYERHLAFSDDRQTSYEEFTAPAGQRALVKLQDGTSVWLNAKTTLRYPDKFSRKERRVKLDGEAFFDVKNNDDIPFVVSTSRLDIKVTGTSFNVFAYKGQEEIQTSLIEGSVWVYDKRDESKRLELNPNERAVLAGNRLYKEPFTQTDFLLWKDGIYAFDNLPFGEIVKKLELYYDITIIVENEKLENYKFSGKFRQRDGVESVLRALRKIRYFDYQKDDELNIVVIT